MDINDKKLEPIIEFITLNVNHFNEGKDLPKPNDSGFVKQSLLSNKFKGIELTEEVIYDISTEFLTKMISLYNIRRKVIVNEKYVNVLTNIVFDKITGNVIGVLKNKETCKLEQKEVDICECNGWIYTKESLNKNLVLTNDCKFCL